MAYTIRYTRAADEDLAFFTKQGQASVESSIRDAVPVYLSNEPTKPTRRIKRLEPNPLEAPWRLRLDPYRVFYVVDDTQQAVSVLRVGYKPRETLYLRGVRFPMRVD